MLPEKMAYDTGMETAKQVDASLRKAWSIMDAAREKPAPSQYLKPGTIKAIQGS